MQLTSGSRWASSVCETEIIVLRAPEGPVDLRCGGYPMVPLADRAEVPTGSVDSGLHDGTVLGKRYTHAETELVVLCTKGGEGSLSLGGEPLELHEAKLLPSSD